jgi:hypothetical protein
LKSLAASLSVLVGLVSAVAAQGAAGSELLSEREVVLPRLGLELRDVRTLGPDGRIARVGLTADGVEVDIDALRREEHALARLASGNMASTLRAAVDALPEGERLDVAFWLLEPGDGVDLARELGVRVRGLPTEAMADGVRAARLAVRDLAVMRFAPRNAAFAEAVTARGGEVLLTATAWPVVVARLDGPSARSLATHPLVDEAYLSQPAWEHEGNFAQGTLRSPSVHAQGVLADGSVRVMVNDTAQVQVGQTYLPPVITLNGASTASHATGVAGNIANTHPLYQAAAYTLPQIYSAGGSGDVAAPPIWDTALLNGVDIGNCSWWNGLKGQIEFLDRFFDYTVRNFSVMMFKSNGNQGQTSTPYGTTPGNGFNVICTGNYNDGNSVAWGDDTMTPSSSYWNPIEGHEKPEVASPGDCVATTTTGTSGIQTCFNGTSSASPLTCGVAALLLSGDNTLLSQMTTLKAALMVSAWHNVEGPAVLSDKDGAGGVHAAAAWSVVRDQQWWYDDVVAADFVGGVMDFPLPVVVGEEVRVIALWFGRANSSYSTDVLDMDIDMAVLDPGGQPVQASASAVNPFELLVVRPGETGTYTVRLTLQRFDGVIEPLTVAWSSRNDTATARIELADGSAPFDPGEVPTLRFVEPYEGALGFYVAWAALSGPAGQGLGGGYALPTGVDGLSVWSAGLPGFLGQLDAAGEATGSIPISPNPAFLGLPVHFGLVVVGPAGTVSDIQTVSNDTVFVIGS